MNKRRHRPQLALVVVGLFLIWARAAFGGADLEREQRLADEIVDAILDGDPVDLDADGHTFLGIYTESEAEEVRGGVIILHGRGFHPDWGNVVQPLRVGLIDSGWNTLSIQMPVLPKDAKYYDYVPVFPEAWPRINTAIDYLKHEGNERVIVIAHSCGAHMAMSWAQKTGAAGIDGYVGIGMGATDYQQPMAEPFPLANLKVPILDIYGEEDFPAVQRLAPERKAAIEKAGNEKSRQVVIEGADHYYLETGDSLVDAVSEWLGTL